MQVLFGAAIHQIEVNFTIFPMWSICGPFGRGHYNDICCICSVVSEMWLNQEVRISPGLAKRPSFVEIFAILRSVRNQVFEFFSPMTSLFPLILGIMNHKPPHSFPKPFLFPLTEIRTFHLR